MLTAIRSYFIGRNAVNKALHEWSRNQLPQGIGHHGTTIGPMGRFDIQENEIKTIRATKDLFISCPKVATDYALGLASSSTGLRSEADSIGGNPAVITILDVDQDKLKNEYGCIVIPEGIEFTCKATKVCEKLAKDIFRAHMLPRIAGMVALGGLLTVYSMQGKKSPNAV